MAWEARSGLKLKNQQVEPSLQLRLNGLGSPFEIET